MKYLIFLATMVFSYTSFGQTKEEYYEKASALFDKNDFKKAIVEIDKFLLIDSTDLNSLLLKANVLFKLKDYQNSFNLFTDIIKLYPTNTTALNQRGLLLQTVQEFDAAIEDYTMGLKLTNADSVKRGLYLNRGAAKIGVRNFQGAYDDFIRAYKIDSLDIGILNNLATVCDEVGKGEETLKYLYKILSIDSSFIGAYINIGFKYQEDGDYIKAIQYFSKAIQLKPNEPLAYSNRSFNYLKTGNLKAALVDVNKSLLLYPENSFAFKNRALIYIEMRQPKKACSDLSKAIELGFTTMYGQEAEELMAKYCNKKESKL